MLNQLLRDERTDVRVVEDVVDGVVQILRGCLVGRQHGAVQQRLGADVVLGLVGDHRVDVVRDAGRRRGRTASR